MTLTKEEAKQVAKDAIQEWLDVQFIALGKWSARLIGGSLLCVALYMILKANGWSVVRELPFIR